MNNKFCDDKKLFDLLSEYYQMDKKEFLRLYNKRCEIERVFRNVNN